ncbi:hypothetical protein FIBSPDRAFT_844731 [Athelia psychrophila]|uniref:Uncharacterized protein n=1 Tax=Athelia psychrophila TaxID=1759441 RepID=A0A167U7J5_9AGAM|nr:hypothetical protein FIBSPDRAFT_844731 [Fibularhizoctonia sp. CBS 109695]
MTSAFLLICLSLVQACIAPAVSESDTTSNPASSVLDTSFAFASSESTSNTCHDINNCRTMVGIVTSCLATIFACIWVAVHPNMPGPKQSWMSRQIRSLKLVVVTLLVPEWVLAWAVRQYLQARRYGKKLEAARLKADADAARPASQAITNNLYTKSSSSDEGGEQSAGIGLEEQSVLLKNSTGVDGVSGWDDNYGDQSLYILALVKSRSLVPPTSDELGDKSKGDALSKTIAILQTLWFIAQCIARRVGNLAITNLEIMTLAYTVITLAMYTAWWHKPLNVRCPIRVKRDAKIVDNTEIFEWTADVSDYVIGEQDYNFRLSGEEQVPIFWSSCCSLYSGHLPLYADIIALSIAMVFGAVHCAAWSYSFPSLAERRMWRVCAIAIAAIPLPMAAAFAVSDPFNGTSLYGMLSMALGALLYICARIILLVLSFTTLRHLPLSAFETIQWTTWIPHV